MSDTIETLWRRIRKLEAVAGRLASLDAARRVPGFVATTDATVTTLLAYPVPANTVSLLVAHVSARRTAGGNAGAGYVRRGTYRNDAGVVTLIGAVQDDYTAEDTAGWDCTLDISGTDVRVRVTGAAATAIDWQGVVEVTEAS